MMSLVLLASAWAYPTDTQNKPPKVVKTVTVREQRFKVVWRGSQAEVSRKGMFFKADANMHLAAIEAAERVSGCHATSNFTPAIGMVEVALDCAP